MSRDAIRAELADSCHLVSAPRPLEGWSRNAFPPAGRFAGRFEASHGGATVEHCDVYWIGHTNAPKIYYGIWLNYFYFDQEMKLIGFDWRVID